MSTYTTIWMVTSGWYSDITWAAAFTTKELAEQSINEGGLGDDIHELKLFDKELEKVSVLTIGCGTNKGFALPGERGKWVPWERTEIWHPELHQPPECEATHIRNLVVTGTDHERVRKVFGERRAELMAFSEELT